MDVAPGEHIVAAKLISGVKYLETIPTDAAGDPIDLSTAGVAQGDLTDFSGTIAMDATSQLLVAANLDRRYLLVHNISDDTLWIDFGVDAVEDEPSVRLLPGDIFVMESMFISTQDVNIIGPTAGAKFTAKEG